MDTPPLEDGETVIHTTQRLIINGTSHTGTLTDRRFILTDTESGALRISIPFADVELAAADTNRLREPVIRITYTTPDGGARGIELIFVYQVGARNVQNRDKSIGLLEERGVPVQPAPPDAYRILDRKESMQAGTLVVEGPDARPQAPAWSIYGTQDGGKGSKEVPNEVSPMLTIAVGILLAAIVIWAMTVPLPEPREPSYLAKISVTPVVTKTVAAAITTAVTIAPSQKPPVQPTAKDTGGTPGDGVWIRISSPGSYTGTITAGGWQTVINSTGTRFYQLPVQNTVIGGSIEKMEGTGDRLDVEIFNGGSSIWQSSTTKPKGMIEIHAPVGAAITNTQSPFQSYQTMVTEVRPTPEISLALQPIPPTGIWVRVAYPGDFSGTIRTNGFEREVYGSGVRDYQVSLITGTVAGSIGKEDASIENLVIEVYKENALISRANTSRPWGFVEFQTLV